jgi:hypothetical protein
MYLTALRIVNRNRGPGVIDEHLLAGTMLLPQHQVQLLQPAPIQIAESAVAIAFRVALTRFLPDQLQRQVLVRLQFLVDLCPVRLRVFAPDGGSRTVGEQPPLNLLITPLLRLLLSCPVMNTSQRGFSGCQQITTGHGNEATEFGDKKLNH